MVKKSRPKKHKPQSGLNYTPLDGLRSQGKTLKSPLTTLPGGTTFRSWVDECIPNIVWACILIAHLERKECLALFRSVVINIREKLPEAEYKNTFVTHNFLSLLTDKQFDIIFENVLLDDRAKDFLSALLLIDCLPDKAHWQRYLTAPDTERHGQILAGAVMACFDHQSQESTDIRWIKVMNLICTGRMIFPESMKERLEEFRVYPDKGDMRSVRPSIRAMEMSTRTLEFGEENPQVTLPPQHKDQFWSEMFQKSTCNIMEEFEPPALPVATIKQEIYDLYHEVSNHFDKTITHTGIDAKHDASFGLVLYAMTLAFDNALGYSHTLVEGRIILRSIMESFVTLHYLKHKDDDTIWKKYRSDGSGKTKLAFLKNIKADEVPEFIDIERLERLANEDMWLEFQDINIGSWAKSDLRTMATEAGVKDVYDKYYDWASGYTHAQWVCVRDTTFTVCINPLHRFHRIPVPPRTNMPSILPDACKLINRMLDDLNALYPPFKPRLKAYNLKDVIKKKAASDAEVKTEQPA